MDSIKAALLAYVTTFVIVTVVITLVVIGESYAPKEQRANICRDRFRVEYFIPVRIVGCWLGEKV